MGKTIIYATIGNNWGKKIFKILKNKNKKVFKLNTNSKFKKYKDYLTYLENEIDKKKINLVWISIDPFKNLPIIKFFIKRNVNLIIEKPWVHKSQETLKLIKMANKNKTKIFFHFEFVFLKKLENIINKDKIKNVLFTFMHRSNKKSKIPAKYEFGSHLASIKVLHFNNLKNYRYKFGYNKKENIRQISINFEKQTKIIDFTKNKEDIIGKFIYFVEKVLIQNRNNFLDLKFAKKVNYELNRLT